MTSVIDKATSIGLDDDCQFATLSCDPMGFWIYLGLSIFLIMLAGLMAGLTMGLLSIDLLNVRILQMEGTPDEKKQADKVLPIVKQHHLLLVTLLLSNALANEALPIFLSKLVPEAVSIILSVTCVLLFGEIIPSAVFTGPRQLRISAALTPLVRFFILITYPLSYPISKILDCVFGSDHVSTKYKRNELKALIALQRDTETARKNYIHDKRESLMRLASHESTKAEEYTPRGSKDGNDSNRKGHFIINVHDEKPLDNKKGGLKPKNEMQTIKHGDLAYSTNLHVDEVTIIHGALDLSSKAASDVMIPMDHVYTLSSEACLDENLMTDILATGYSRIPIYANHKSNIVGLLLVKKLIVLDPDDARQIHTLGLRKPIVIQPNESCYSILNEFQKGRSHIALVTKDTKKVLQCWETDTEIPESVEFLGIVTIEDVLEELIQEEIEDESDTRLEENVKYWTRLAKRHRKMRRESMRSLGSRDLTEYLGTDMVTNQLKKLAKNARRRVSSRHRNKQVNKSTNKSITPKNPHSSTSFNPKSMVESLIAPIPVTVVKNSIPSLTSKKNDSPVTVTERSAVINEENADGTEQTIAINEQTATMKEKKASGGNRTTAVTERTALLGPKN